MQFGIDRLLADPDLRKPLAGRRVALLAHPASVTATAQSTGSAFPASIRRRASLLFVGSDHNGRWRLAPCGEFRATRRRYRGDTLILETELDTAEGTVHVVDFMPPRRGAPHVVRVVEGVRGRVRMSNT